MTYLLALDQGTSSSRSIVFDRQGQIVAMSQLELPQIYPQPGWVEHDPMVIWRTQMETARTVLAKAGLSARDIGAVGITNQRETTVVWNRRTGQPIHNAIVWQDRRAEPSCARLRAEGKAEMIQAKTGLLIDAYFSGTKLQWILDNVPNARALAAAGDLLFGTIDSWLIWQLTGGYQDSTRAKAVHATDVSNASRTMLLNVHTNQWDPALLQLLDIPDSMMPRVRPSSADFGQTQADLLGAAIPIGGVAGDQQSALFGQACFSAGMAKNTYGTGCFMPVSYTHLDVYKRQHQHEAARAVGILGHPIAETGLPEQGGVLVTGNAGNWNSDTGEDLRVGMPVDATGWFDFGQHAGRDVHFVEHLPVPLQLLDIEQHGPRSIGVVGDMDLAASQIPDQPCIDIAEQ